MRRIFAVSVLALFAVVLWTPPATAGSGKINDPAKDVFNADEQTAGAGQIDILGVDFADDGHTATYTIHTKSGFDTADVNKVLVYMQDLDGLDQYDCSQLTASITNVKGALEPKLTHCLGSGSGPDGGPGGTEEYGGVTATHVDGEKKITITVDLDVLRAAGFTGMGYSFSVLIRELSKENIQDQAPNQYKQRHDLSYPNPLSTPEPAAAPTKSAGPKSDATAEPGPTDDATGFASPAERASDGGGIPVAAVAVGGTLAAIGAGLAFYRFRPL
ncbi:MAG: hypothetical protein WD646_11005 [Actinomycetota bacterium]